MSQNREEWLIRAVDLMRPWFDDCDERVPDALRVSTGWHKGGKKTTVGQCWPRCEAIDGVNQIFITPNRDDGMKVLATLLHEMCHAANDCRDGARGGYLRLWKHHGFEGKPTTSEYGPELGERLASLLEVLGPYPHGALRDSAKAKTQATFMLKVECPRSDGCGFYVRTTRKMLALGLPTCPCGAEMVEAEVAGK